MSQTAKRDYVKSADFGWLNDDRYEKYIFQYVISVLLYCLIYGA